MTRDLRSFSAGILIALSAMLGVPSLSVAGPLNGHPDALPTWTGSTPFSSGNLTGFIDWAVFGPGDFPAGYTFVGAPAIDPSDLVYAYQITVTGSSPLSSLSISVVNPVMTIGYFSGNSGNGLVDGQIPNFSSVDTGNDTVDWGFSGILQGGTSKGLAFSAEGIPEDSFGVVVDTGFSDDAYPLPVPSSILIPEPASLGLALMGLSCGLIRRRRSA